MTDEGTAATAKVELRLRSLTLDYAIDLIPFRNHPAVQEHLRHPGKVTPHDQTEWFGRCIVENSPHRMWALESTAKLSDGVTTAWRLVGCGGITYIDLTSRRGELSLYTVPDDLEWHAGMLLLDRAFRQLDLRRVEAEAFTQRRIQLCRDLGFMIEGTRRESYLRDGQYLDALQFGMLAAEFDDVKANYDWSQS